MKELLCSFALLFALGSVHAATFAQEYEERPARRLTPLNQKLIAKESAKPAADAANVASISLTALSAPATVRGEGDNDEPYAGNTASSDALPSASISINISDITITDNTPRLKRAITMQSPSAVAIAAPAVAANAPAVTNSPTPIVAAPTSIYRVGEGDILDIRILNSEVQSASTLYTVLGGGLLEYPLIGEPLAVAGLTPEEINLRVSAELKRREVFENPQVIVSVREYVSHTATLSGLVEHPGVKVLRREAVPLYVLLAEASPRSEAGQVVITNPATRRMQTVNLSDSTASETLIQAGDVLRVVALPPQFFYVGGEVGAPGQKNFHTGLTLTQAVLAAGGATRRANGRVRVSRQGQDGLLIASEYNLREIEAGRAPDPSLQAGDRIELNRKR